MAVAVVMVLPGIAGSWAADYWKKPWFTLVGWAVGLTVGFTFLMIVTGVWKSKRNAK